MALFCQMPHEVQEIVSGYILGRLSKEWSRLQPMSVYDKIMWSQFVDDQVPHPGYLHHRIAGPVVQKMACLQELRRTLWSTEWHLDRAYTIRNFMELWNTSPRYWDEDTGKMYGWYLGRGGVVKTKDNPL